MGRTRFVVTDRVLLFRGAYATLATVAGHSAKAAAALRAALLHATHEEVESRKKVAHYHRDFYRISIPDASRALVCWRVAQPLPKLDGWRSLVADPINVALCRATRDQIRHDARTDPDLASAWRGWVKQYGPIVASFDYSAEVR